MVMGKGLGEGNNNQKRSTHMNKETGVEYGFSWWRRAAAVAAAGTLSLGLVGCEKPADEQ